MNVVHEELWQDPRVDGGHGLIAVTTNNVVQGNGALVMGGGAALQAAKRIPNIRYQAGVLVRRHTGLYGFLVVRKPTDSTVGFGIFQTKEHYRDPSNSIIISNAVAELQAWALINPYVQIRLNFPGIGLGGMSVADVLPFLEVLPDNVTICRR